VLVTKTVADLLKVDVVKRDSAWDLAFTKALPQARFNLLEQQAKVGPDGWPYLFVQIDDKGTESADQVLRWCSTRGIGMAVNPNKDMPDFVMTFGMIWNYTERGELITALPESASREDRDEVTLEHGQKVKVGPPSDGYLPTYARTVLKQFLFDQGVLNPKVLVMLSDDELDSDLCFSTESLDDPPEEEHSGIAEALAWFLPAHYSVVLLSETVLDGFVAL
jgi:hypothetical protein